MELSINTQKRGIVKISTSQTENSLNISTLPTSTRKFYTGSNLFDFGLNGTRTDRDAQLPILVIARNAVAMFT